MITKTDYKYFEKAASISEFSDYKKAHYGCVAVYKNQIIGIGYNTNKTHPLQKHYNKQRIIKGEYNPNLLYLPKLHAEISCINQIKHLDIDFSKVKLYIYRSRKDRPYSLSHPCKSCLAAIKDCGIKNIYYCTDEGYAYERIA